MKRTPKIQPKSPITTMKAGHIAKTGGGLLSGLGNALNIVGTGALVGSFFIPSADVRKREKLLARQEELAKQGKLYMPIEPPVEAEPLQPGSLKDTYPPEYR